ncbi:MAG: hypothetical protein HYZ45_01390 [Burkholderiales bacterium]|nr:hypothetical protein [Burkholderiales bacterium]
MSRTTRAELGQRALSIIEQGAYQSRRGVMVNISADLQRCVAATELWPEPDLLQLRQQLLQQEVLSRC